VSTIASSRRRIVCTIAAPITPMTTIARSPFGACGCIVTRSKPSGLSGQPSMKKLQPSSNARPTA
jgi:hypothetical protein